MAERMIFVEKLDDITECPVCTESYTDPRSLPCVHTFCLKCITEWNGNKQSGGSVDCPLCRKSFEIPKDGIGGLPKNIFVAKLLAMKEAPGDIPTKLCGPCSANRSRPIEETNKAVFFCVECQDNLCETCRDVHSRMKLSRSHHTVTVKEKLGIPMFSLPAVCVKHTSNELELYCLDCQEALCRMCFVTQHNGHRSDKIANIVGSFKEDISKIIRELQRTSLQTVAQALKNVQDIREKCVETFSVVEREVCMRADELRTNELEATLERHKQQLLTELTRMKIKKLKNIDNKIKEITRDKALLKSFIQFSEELLMNGSDGNIAREWTNLKLTTMEMKQLCEEERETLLPETAVTFTPTENCDRHDRRGNIIGSISDDAAVNTATFGPTKPDPAGAPETNEPVIKLCPTLTLSLEVRGFVTAIGSLGGLLYVTKIYGDIDVYDASTLTHRHSFSVPGSSKELNGLAACTAHNLLYVADTGCNKIITIWLTGWKFGEWTVTGGPHGLSVNRSHNLLVACQMVRKIREYNVNGSLLREIKVENHPYHAAEVSPLSKTVVVSWSGRVGGVSLKSVDGKNIKTYQRKGPGKMSSPICLAVDSKGFILVADFSEDGIHVLTPELTEACRFPLPRGVELKRPWALHYEEPLGFLYVSDFERLLLFSNVFNLSSLFRQQTLSSACAVL